MATARAQVRQALQDVAAALQPLLSEALIPPTEDYDVVRADLVNRLGDAFIDYVSSRIGTAAMAEAKRAVTEDVPGAFYRGYRDAGGEETDDGDEKWLTATQRAQLAWLEKAFADLKAVRRDGTAKADDLRARAEVWGVTLDGIYAEGKLRGRQNVMLTLDGDDGEESCVECQRYKGKRHSAKWWLKRDLVRRNGNTNYTCGRWGNCHHHFYTDDGELYAE